MALFYRCGRGSGWDANARFHIIEKGNDALYLRIPLAAARALSSFPGLIAGYTAGIDLGELASMVEGAAPGTLVDIDDGDDRVVITLG